MAGLMCIKQTLFKNSHLENLFGFYYCIIDASKVKNEYIGLLPVIYKGLTFPLGKWSGWYFAEILKFAANYGYVINIKESYSFDKNKNVFNNYIKDVYAHKVNAKNAK